MKIKHLFLSVFFLVLTIMIGLSCGQIEDGIYDPEFNVYGVLNNWHVIQEIIVDRTYQMNEPSQPYVDNALVILSTEGYVDTLVFNSYVGLYQQRWSYFIEPATTYEIRVTNDSLDTLYGTTTVPGDFRILNPALDTLSLHDTLVFTKSTGVAFYDCWVTEIISLMDIEFILWPDPDDSLESFVLGDYFYNIPSSFYEISITAYDSNYYMYHLERSDSIYCAGVTGGVGLFGSSWTVEKEFYIVTE